MFTQEDKLKLVEALKSDCNAEQLKDFVAKCIGESALLILAPDTDGKREARIQMIEMLRELQDVALERLVSLEKR